MKRVVVDVDAGTDDGFALFILLHADKIGKIKLEFITCSSGNTTIDHVVTNVVRILELAHRTDIPVYRGAYEQFIPSLFHGDEDFQGADGFGDLTYDHEPDVSIVRKTHAAVALGEFVRANPQEISLIGLAPLTTVALTAKLYPDFGKNLAEVAVMGGNNKAVGNTPNTAEFNFYYDPEAAHIVLSKSECPIRILTWETSLIPQISLDWRVNVLGKDAGPALDLITRAEKKVYEEANYEYWTCCDGFLAIAFVHPETVTKEEPFHATVELHGTNTRGQLVLDHRGKKRPNVIIIENVDEEAIKRFCMKAANEM